MIVIWIDPWTTTIWYSIIEKKWTKKTLIDYWVISTIAKISLEKKIIEIAKDIEQIIDKYKPDRVVIEKLFFTNNVKTWIDVSHVRWVIIYLFAKHNIQILEYTPLELKSAICSNWKADKLQLQKAIKIFFDLDEIPKPDDAADAIWLAYMWILKN